MNDNSAQAQISIIIVNWNAGLQLAELVSSISQYHHDLVSSVIIVDNASTDNSLAQIRDPQDLPFKLQLIHNADNRGFAKACNQGAAIAASEYLLFLNPDTRLFENSLPAPLNFMRQPENVDVGIVGIQLLNEQGDVAKSCARFPSLRLWMAQVLGLDRVRWLRHLGVHMNDWPHDKTRNVDHVIGAFYFIRRSLFELLGGFDERFFVYLEDIELSLRASKSGWKSFYLTDGQAFHAGGGTSRQVQAHRLFYSLRSRLLYGFKHFGRLQAWTLVLVTLVLEPISRSIFSMLRGSRQDMRNNFLAYHMLLKDMLNRR